jgi:putative ribosome biogenesis GTPase RsgA
VQDAEAYFETLRHYKDLGYPVVRASAKEELGLRELDSLLTG